MREDIKNAQADSLIYESKYWFRRTGLPAKPVHLRCLHNVLEKWVGHKLDAKLSVKDDLISAQRKTAATDGHVPFRLHPGAHAVLNKSCHHAKHKHVPGLDGMLYSIQEYPDAPILALDRHSLSLVARVYADKVRKSPDLKNQHTTSREQQVEPLNEHGALAFAANVLARYGAHADFNHDDVLSETEAAAVRATISALPIVLDERLSPASRLASAYNISRGLADRNQKRRPPPIQDNAVSHSLSRVFRHTHTLIDREVYTFGVFERKKG